MGAGERDVVPSRPHASMHLARNIRRRRLMRQQQLLRRRHAHRSIAIITLAVLFTLLVPAGIAGASAYAEYIELRGLASSALHHLLDAKSDLLPSSGSTSSTSGSSCATATDSSLGVLAAPRSATSSAVAATTRIPDAAAMSAAHSELQAAQGDFATLRTRLSDLGPLAEGAALSEPVNSTLTMVRELAVAGYDVATIGEEWTAAASPIVARLHGSAGLGGQSLLTKADLTALQRAADNTVVLLGDVQARVGGINLALLPLCAGQKEELTSLVGQLPRIRSLAQEVDGLLPAAGWILGVDAPRHFLVQTLDRSELRPTGGFAGEYGILSIENGKIGSLTLNNVDLLDYGHYSNGWAINNRPPAVYSWWPVANWGLRDANLSADFPTNAQLVMSVYAKEGGGSVDGLINVTPIAIAHVLKVTGPMTIPLYNETVTADNLEQKIHYYQLDPAGEARNHQLFPNDTPAFARKRFAQLLAQQLEDRVKHLPLSELTPLAKQLVADMQSRDIQVYLTNAQLENLLEQRHAAGSMATPAGTDSFFVVHTNWSAAKSTPHIQVSQTDDVVLDASGGATHHLTVTMRNVVDGTPYYGFTTYQDFVRVYAPPGAKLLSADGFDTGTPLCQPVQSGQPVQPGQPGQPGQCSATPYPRGELVCPPGGYVAGDRTNTLAGNDHNRPLDAVGGPTTTRSDVAGRAMWGGNVVIPPSCTATLSLSWHVANVAAPTPRTSGTGPYMLTVQRQAGTFYPVTVTLHPAAGVSAQGAKTVSYKAVLDADYIFTPDQPPHTYPPGLSLAGI